MDSLIDLVRVAVTPISDLLFARNDRIYWLYLLCAATIALAVRSRRERFGHWRRALGFFLSPAIALHRSARADYALWFLNNLVLLPAGSALWLSDDAVQSAAQAGLTYLFGAGFGWSPGWPAQVLYTAFNILAIDGGLFLSHYLHHRIPVLWEFHKVHHSAEVLTPITVFRIHPIELCLNTTAIGILVGSVAAAFGFLYGELPPIFALNGINVVMFAFLVTGYHLRHSHVWIMYPAVIARHISSPAMHLIHHSSDPRHIDRNFAQIFNFWDRIAGTLYLPTEQEKIQFGLSGGEEREFRSVIRLYVQPFRNLWRIWQKRVANADRSVGRVKPTAVD